jgi:hypothetical protein
MRICFVAVVLSLVALSGCARSVVRYGFSTEEVLGSIERASLPRDGTVPEDLWSERLRSLEPIRVYRKGPNVLAVKAETETTETGYYFLSKYSSSLPLDSERRKFVWNNRAKALEYTFLK